MAEARAVVVLYQYRATCWPTKDSIFRGVQEIRWGVRVFSLSPYTTTGGRFRTGGKMGWDMSGVPTEGNTGGV